MFLAQGNLLIVSMHNILNDKSYWGDPEVMRPERFLDSTGTKIVNYERACVFGMGNGFICVSCHFILIKRL